MGTPHQENCGKRTGELWDHGRAEVTINKTSPSSPFLPSTASPLLYQIGNETVIKYLINIRNKIAVKVLHGDHHVLLILTGGISTSVLFFKPPNLVLTPQTKNPNKFLTATPIPLWIENRVDPDPITKHAEMRPEPDKSAPPPPPKKKNRQIVSWTAEEDELLREQVSAHGVENWTSIAAKFNDKTSRQCRRRWYTYLNSEGKKGGWSPEEDMILCEAQKIFGNRWTEIAKVVSGRTDNAVKNRFSTLCKKRTKNDALSKENNSSWVNRCSKKVITQNESFISGRAEASIPVKHFRHHILDHGDNNNTIEGPSRRLVTGKVQLRPPLSVLDQNSNILVGLPTQYHHDNNCRPSVYDGLNAGSFLRRDDPKLTKLLQQAEMLSSLALKVNNSENTCQSLENAWKELQDYLSKNGESDTSEGIPDMEFLLDDFKDLIEDLGSNSIEEQASWRQPSAHESQDSSEFSTGSTQVFQVPTNDINQIDDIALNQNSMVSIHQEDDLGPSIDTSQGTQSVGALPSSECPKEDTGIICTGPSPEFDSPHQTILAFHSLKEGIPTPTFSASERKFLLSVLGISCPDPSSSSSQPPSCKRVLLDNLRYS